jgi:5-methylcytosine-specific restriction endonuclease McrA
MPNPKDPAALQAYREKQRAIALDKGYGKWMRGKTLSDETKAKLALSAGAIGADPAERQRRSDRSKALGVGKWMAGRPMHPNALARRYEQKGKTYEEIYGKERAEEERAKRRESNRKRHIGTRQVDVHPDPKHNASHEYKAWRQAVLVRDGHACVICGSKGKLHAHHRASWSKHPELRYDIANGTTLCPACHKDLHRSSK